MHPFLFIIIKYLVKNVTLLIYFCKFAQEINKKILYNV